MAAECEDHGHGGVWEVRLSISLAVSGGKLLGRVRMNEWECCADRLVVDVSHVPANQPISFRGTDLLTIDLASRKVRNVTTSADLLEYYRDLGYDLGVWTA